MKKISYLLGLGIFVFLVGQLEVNAGCGPRGCAEPYTDSNKGACTSSTNCNCQNGPMDSQCLIRKPIVNESERNIIDETNKQITHYDVGYIAVWKSSSGAWQNGLKPGGAINSYLVNISFSIPSITNATNIKYKSIEVAGINGPFNDIIKKYALKNYSISYRSFSNNGSYFSISFAVTASALVPVSGSGTLGQNVKLPWQLDAVEGYFYYVPTKIVLTYEEAASAQCNINNSIEFGVGAGVRPGTGPNGTNCCDYFINLYKNDSKKLNELYNKYPICKQGGGGSTNNCSTTIKSNTACGVNASFKDTTNWDSCIFKNEVYRDNTLGNSYCPVYCREELTTDFPANGYAVIAGQNFTYEPVGFVGKRQCKTKSINFTQWEKDWKKVNDALPNLYDEMEIAEKKQDAVDNYASKKRESVCGCVYNTSHNSCCRSETSEYHEKTCSRCCERETRCSTKSDGSTSCSSVCTQRCKYDCSYYTYPCTNKDNTYHYRYYPKTVYYDGKNITPSPFCSTPDYGVPTKQSAYSKKYEERLALEKNILDCNNLGMKYNLNPNVTLNYTYLGSAQSFVLEDYIVANKLTSRYYSGTKTGYSWVDSKILDKYECSGEGCANHKKDNTVDFKMPLNTQAEQEYNKSIYYELNSGVYRYVLKPSGVSVHQNQLGSDYKNNGNYYDVGYGNLPVHYTTVPGNYPISLLYSNIGHNNNFNKYLKNNPEKYSCQYSVTNPGFGNECNKPNPPGYCNNPGGETTKGVDIVYRVVALDNPFPGKNGKGRVSGSNWEGYTNLITDNRNVKGKAVYDKQPLYEIVLTPAIIKDIRSYNKTRVTQGGYADFVLTCESGKKCKSTFVSKYFGTYGKGVCLNATSANFYTCVNK